MSGPASRSGLEFQDARVIAVAVDGRGEVHARAVVDVRDGDFAEAANNAAKQISAADGAILGIAALTPELPSVAAAMATLGSRFAVAQTRAVSSGTASAVAEAWAGAARGAQDVVFFGIGVHATGGIVRAGEPVVGRWGRAASVGWLALNPVEREDYRKAGCLEAEVSAAGIVRRLIWRIKAGDRSRVQDTVKDDLGAITVDHVLEAARAGDGVSISVIRDTAKYLGMAAANIVVVTDPEALVLGGIMASAADLLLDPLRTEIARRLPKSMTDALRIETATLGDEGAAIGAAHLGGVSGR
jgi:predicted NBD/HSP70 family sugar kinase